VRSLGFDPIMFLASNRWFPAIIVGSDIWKEFGFAAIIYLAALAGINPNLYEAAEMDGASRVKQLLYVTLPSLLPTVILLATLSIGNILNAGFDQIFNLYNPLVYSSGDIIDTYVYRVGLVQAQYGFATAVGLMKSLVGFAMIVLSYRIAYKYANYRIF
jgi:putative aldouronate transport system permease protein